MRHGEVSGRLPGMKDWPRWDAPSLQVKSDSTRTARYRLLQSWYRETQLGAAPGLTPVARKNASTGKRALVGSMLDSQDQRRKPGDNFLDPTITRYVESRIPVVQLEGGSLDPLRLRNNMLSSMPLCFNLFGYLQGLKDDPLVVAALAEAFGLQISTVDEIECEWAPKDSGLPDRTAFDAVLLYRDRRERRCLLGIETKYTEPFSQTVYERPEYVKLTKGGEFLPMAAEKLQGRATNQLWRNALLALSIVKGGEFAVGQVAVVALRGDKGAEKALKEFREQLLPPKDLIRDQTLEDLIGRFKAIPSTRAWARKFERRYLDLSPVEAKPR